MAEFIYVDNSNLFIEGRRLSAVQSGKAEDIRAASDWGILDIDFVIDFGHLYQFLCGDSQVGRCYLVGSRPPPNDTIWKIAKSVGFEVHVEDRNLQNKEKKVDTGIVTEMLIDALQLADRKNDTITLVAGDGDYVPAVTKLIESDFNVEVAFWSHGSRELQDCCSKFISLNEHIDHLRYQK